MDTLGVRSLWTVSTGGLADFQKRGFCFWETQSVDSGVLKSGLLRLLATNMPASPDIRKGLLSFLKHLVPSMGKTIP